jgi:drug/metabolite transporter (DMT)-like permease
LRLEVAKAVLRHQLNVFRHSLLVVASSSRAGSGYGAAYAGWHHALGNVTSTAASQTVMPVPLVAATAGVMIRGEHLSLSSIAATKLIIGGVSLAIWRETMRPRPT